MLRRIHIPHFRGVADLCKDCIRVHSPLHINRFTVIPTEYTEKQPLLSGVHSVMRVKLALAGEGGGCTPTPSHYIYHHQ
jgi:hypothetical protein